MSEEEPEASFLNRWSSRKKDSTTQTTTTNDEISGVSASVVMPLGAESSAVALIDSPASSDDVLQADAISQTSVLKDQDQDLDAAELLLTDADMPPIESLTAESNVSQFFNKGVSASLRKAALRYVFQQPQFNVRDGLNDYDGDYTVFEPLGDIITSDMKFHIARKERDRLAAEAEAEELLQQERLRGELGEEGESADQAETNVEGEDTDQLASDDELAAETDEGVDDEPSSETDALNEPTTLALVDSGDGIPQHASALVEPLEQV